jgi:hypothetical protein
MIPLDSPIWNTLDHAYGQASDIPALLRTLADDPAPKDDYAAEPWHSLWSALCHQGDIYTASFAAVPHIVSIAERTSDIIAWDFFGLPAAIEVARAHKRGPDLTSEFAHDYRTALRKLHDVAHRLADLAWDATLSQAIAAALAVSKGHIDLGRVFTELGPQTVRDFLVWQKLEKPDAP